LFSITGAFGDQPLNFQVGLHRRFQRRLANQDDVQHQFGDQRFG